uniref:ABM domain-containing protein n=1 Tax=viral metagenome TaxID=1070528 RepID=A0A6C0AXZ6_9ZZZZ|tara:strand:- start:922 stop:1272 length:351 start_codon:yes stop_codon:yes gene_type:complete
MTIIYMSKIRIFSEKILKNTYYTRNFINYSNELSEIAKKYKGFISSSSYFVDNIDLVDNTDTIKIITISEWKNVESWNSWKKSSNRKNISNQYTNLETSEKFNILYNRTNNDIFLL